MEIEIKPSFFILKDQQDRLTKIHNDFSFMDLSVQSQIIRFERRCTYLESSKKSREFDDYPKWKAERGSILSENFMFTAANGPMMEDCGCQLGYFQPSKKR
jgi:hypothetical protein